MNEGLDLAEVLAYVTANPADVLDLQEKGHIREGADGDLLLMKKEDLKLDTVIAMGRLMMRGGEILVKGTYE